MGVGSQQELQEIRETLFKIEKRLEEEKYRPLIIGVIVAVITAIATTIGTFVTNRKQEEVKRELTQSVEKLGEMGKLVAQKQMAFYNRATSLLNDIDDSFHEVCYFSPTQTAEKKLADSLDSYRKLLEETTEEITDENLRAEMKKYSEFVVEKLRLIKEPGRKIGDEEKSQYYIQSRTLLKSVKTHLNKVLTSGIAQQHPST